MGAHPSRKGKKRKEKTMPFGINLMRSQVFYWAAQVHVPLLHASWKGGQTIVGKSKVS